ncbi:NAD(P)-dependent oxidoreductase [Azorhizophilus paspali]|uniref:NAD(P)-dependent oxidoreductase n=1 Tax=Azorhizophilus paspali TaxID=69963 RepID=A0ABV6SN15_AZOPA
MGIVGLGRIGLAIARRATAFDMSIVYCGRRPRPVDYRYFASVHELAAQVDFLVVSVNGKADTRHLIEASVLDVLGSKGILVNVGRGSVFEDEPRVHPGCSN